MRWHDALAHRQIAPVEAADDAEHPHPIVATAPVEITAAEDEGDGLPRVRLQAYDGGPMRVAWWGDIVLDLEGAELSDQIKLLGDHNRSIPGIVGYGSGEIRDNRLFVKGVLSRANELTALILGLSEDGVRFEASVGVDPRRWEEVEAGESVQVNGRSVRASGSGLTVIRSWRLRETSILPFGASDETAVDIAALAADSERRNGMKFEEWLAEHGIDADEVGEERIAALKAAFEAGEDPPEPQASTPETDKADPESEEPKDSPRNVEGAATDAPEPSSPGPDETPRASGTRAEMEAASAALAKEEAEGAVRRERERVAAIQEVCAGEFPQIEREAIRAGWDIEETGRKVLKAMRESRPQADVNVSVGSDMGREGQIQTLEATLCLRAGIGRDWLESDYDGQVVRSALRERHMSLQQVFAECARMEGITVPRSFSNDTIRAGFSTVSLPGILNNVANKKLLKAFQAQPVIATTLCSEGELNDFKQSERYRLTDVGDLEPVAPDGEIKHGGLTEEKATNQLGTYGKIFALTRQMIYNDDLGAFLKVPEGMGARAARKIDQLFFTRLLANPGDLFSADNGNYSEGEDTALAATSLAAAVQMFQDQTDADGQPINITPKFLVVPTALKITAKELLNSITFLAVGSTDRDHIPTYNAMADEDLVPVVSPYLSNANYDGASSVAWYLFADPAIVDTFEIGYLKGRKTPTVERGETDFNTLGIQFRVYFDLGVREQDHRGMVKFKGEA